MNKDKRRTRRRQLKRSAWVALGPGELRECNLFDVSESGARIEVDDARSIPDKFVLFLSSNGAARRACQVVWRVDRQIGVTIRKPAAGSRARRATAANSITAMGK
jgi:PilZ domain